MNRRAVVAGLCAVVLTQASCAKGGGLGTWQDYAPKVRFHKLQLEKLSFEAIDAVFVLEIDNPYPLGIDLGSFSWALKLAGNDFLSGNDRKGSTISPSATSKLRIPVTLSVMDIVSTVQDLSSAKDTVPFRFSGQVGVKTPVGQLKLPYDARGDMPVLRAPKIGFQKIRLDRIDPLGAKATIAIDLAVSHTAASTLKFSGFDYDLSFGGKKVISGLVKDLAEVAPGKTSTVSLPVTIDLIAVGTTIANAITGGGKVDVGLGAKLTVGTPFGDLPLAIDEKGLLRVER